jgi:SnoaL-like domain
VDPEALRTWVEAYRRAWLSNQPAEIEALFSEDAVYLGEPYATPLVGRAAIVEDWLARRDEPGETEFSFELLPAGDELGLVKGRTLYLTEPRREYHNLWVIRLDESGRCTEFTEWWMLVPDD